jgi:hypothetical protein
MPTMPDVDGGVTRIGLTATVIVTLLASAELHPITSKQAAPANINELFMGNSLLPEQQNLFCFEIREVRISLTGT